MPESHIYQLKSFNPLTCPRMVMCCTQSLLVRAALAPIPLNHKVNPWSYLSNVPNAPWACHPSLYYYHWSIFNAAMTTGITRVMKMKMRWIQMGEKWHGTRHLWDYLAVSWFMSGLVFWPTIPRNNSYSKINLCPRLLFNDYVKESWMSSRKASGKQTTRYEWINIDYEQKGPMWLS